MPGARVVAMIVARELVNSVIKFDPRFPNLELFNKGESY